MFNASLVYECLSSVPFNAAVATRLISYWNDTLQFQSTLTYLKDPPAGYQQPAVDLLADISELQDAVSSGAFSNQYEFEVALQLLLVSAHDAHLYLNAGILAAFTFASPFDIVSLSIDGIELPKVYLAGACFQILLLHVQEGKLTIMQRMSTIATLSPPTSRLLSNPSMVKK